MSEGSFLAFLSLAALAVTALSCKDDFTRKEKQTPSNAIPSYIIRCHISEHKSFASLACDFGYKVYHHRFKIQVNKSSFKFYSNFRSQKKH